MAEALLVFDDTISAPEGAAYRARVCGRQAEDGRWEGWLEFDPIGADGEAVDGEGTVRSGRETTQPKRADLLYWAGGLTHTFLEGALLRALGVHGARAIPRRPTGRAPGRPHRAQPGRPRAPQPGAPSGSAGRGSVPAGRPVLDPFEVFLQGEEVLRQELGALSPGHLHNIADAHRLDVGAAARDGDPATLARAIVTAVRARYAALDAPPAGGRDAEDAPRA